MSRHYGSIAFTEPVREAQAEHGSRATYARVYRGAEAAPGPDSLTRTERAFIAERDGFYLATVNETGWPYVQFRGGPPGFLKVLDEHTLAWADFRGNRQYVSTGNLAGEGRVAMFLMDYPHRRRLKLFGRARVAEPPGAELLAALEDPGYDAVVERALLVTVEAFDWNCPQHITPRFTTAEFADRLGVSVAAIEERDCCPAP